MLKIELLQLSIPPHRVCRQYTYPNVLTCAVQQELKQHFPNGLIQIYTSHASNCYLHSTVMYTADTVHDTTVILHTHTFYYHHYVTFYYHHYIMFPKAGI